MDKQTLSGLLEKTLESETRKTSDHYYYSNDLKVSNVIHTLSLSYLEQEHTNESGMALFIGSGCIFSLLSIIPERIAVLLDYDSDLITKLREQMDSILNAHSREEYISSLLVNDELPFNLQSEIKSVGIYHFLASDENFEKTKEVLRDKKIIFGVVDLRDMGMVGKIAKKITAANKRISFANLSNVLEYGSKVDKKDMIKSLQLLPIADYANIMHSTKDRHYHVEMLGTRYGESLPISRLDQGLDAVIDFSRNVNY